MGSFFAQLPASFLVNSLLYTLGVHSQKITFLILILVGHGLDGTNWSKVPWSLKQIGDWGYSRVNVANATALKLEFVRNRSYKVDDYTWLY